GETVEPREFWSGSFFFNDSCYKVVNTQCWYQAKSPCKKDHHQAQIAKYTSEEQVRLISLYVTFIKHQKLR
ncbi:hypothetical protein RRG08_048870, partial [Elysia crispata]